VIIVQEVQRRPTYGATARMVLLADSEELLEDKIKTWKAGRVMDTVMDSTTIMVTFGDQ